MKGVSRAATHGGVRTCGIWVCESAAGVSGKSTAGRDNVMRNRVRREDYEQNEQR